MLRKIITLSLFIFLFLPKTVFAQSWPESLNFPRIQSRHQWGYASVFDFDPIRFSKYDHVGFTNVPLKDNNEVIIDFTQELKKYNPLTRTRIYTNPNNTLESETYPGHYLFFVGGYLSQNINASQETFTVTNPSNFKQGYDAMFWDFTDINDAEHVRIVAVNSNTITVERGYKGDVSLPNFSPARAHKKNVYLSIHVTKGKYNKSWYPNWSLLCKNGNEKECGSIYKNYADYKVPILVQDTLNSKTDGLKIDNAFGPWIPNSEYSIFNLDVNNDGQRDGGKVGGAYLWTNGLINMYKKLRQGMPNALIHGNNAEVNPYLNGKLYQGWNKNFLQNNWQEAMKEYMDFMKNGYDPQFVITDSEVLPHDYQEVRLGLASTLLGNGLYGNKGAEGGVGRGPDVWYDEYDNGAGSSLNKNMNETQNYLEVYPGTGNKFTVGDEIYLFSENMKIVNVEGDRLTVQRAFVSDYLNSLTEKLRTEGINPTIQPSSHKKGEKVYTIHQAKSGKGYLGKPLSAPNDDCAPNKVNSCIRYFDNGVVLVNPTSSNYNFSINGTYYRIKGTQDPLVNSGKKVKNSVTVPARDGLILVKNPIEPSPPVNKPGDANNDEQVDGQDYIIWLSNFNLRTTDGASAGDFNNDTYVDGLDYIIWINNQTS